MEDSFIETPLPWPRPSTPSVLKTPTTTTTTTTTPSPVNRPQSLWNLKEAKKLHVNNKIRDPSQKNMSPEHYF